MKLSKCTIWALVLAVALPLGAAAAANNPVPEVRHELYRLGNGLTVILVENHEVPLVGVNVNYQVGSKNERPGRTGFAHLFEHMMFQGSGHYNDSYFKPLETVGGDVNGATNTDRTRYCELVPPAYLERALWLEADRMGFLLDALSAERLKNQISVVQNERRQSYENQPYGLVEEKMRAVLYPEGHPYHWTTIGSMDDLAAASLEDVKAFFKTYYAPNNASLCIAGDFDPAQAKLFVEEYFGAIPPGPPVSRVESWVPSLPGEVSLAIQDRVQLPRLYVNWHTTPAYGADDAALDAFGEILGGGRTSRLYRRLVQDLQIAQDVSASNDSSQLAGTFEMVVTPRPGRALEEVEREAFAVLQDALARGVTREELDRVASGATARMVKGIQRIGLFGGIPDRMNGYYQFLGTPDRFRWDLQRTLDLTPEQVSSAARKYLGPARVVARVTPRANLAAETAGPAASVDRTVMPGPGPQKPFRLGERQRFTLKNGLGVLLVERHQAPVVEMGLVVGGGSASDPREKEGLCSLAAALLQEGAGSLSSQAFAEAVERLGATLSAAPSQDATTVRLSTLKSTLEAALPLLSDLVARPNLAPGDFERVQKLKATELERTLEQPMGLAGATCARVIFGEGPYGHLVLGTRAGLKDITLGDVKSYWSRYGVPKNAVLAVAGDTTRDELEPLLERTLGRWTGGEAPPPSSFAVPPRSGRSVYLVDRPGSAQSVIMAADSAPARSSPDYASLSAANFPLGGGGVARLYMNLREDKGYTYGAYSSLQSRRGAGLFAAQAQVATPVTVPALREMVMEIEAVAGKKPITDEELAAAKGELAGGYARRFETPSQVASGLQEVLAAGVPDSVLETFPEQVQALALEEVRAKAAELLEPSRIALIVVGDRATVLPELEKAGFGPIVELDSEGRPKLKS